MLPPFRQIGCLLMLGASIFLQASEYADYAEDPLPRYNQTIEVATKTPVLMSLAPSSVSVFTKEDIDRMGVKYLDELLQWIPGFMPDFYNYSEVDYYQGEKSALSRGAYNRSNAMFLLLRDGVRLNEAYWGSIDLTLRRIPLRSIKKVEIIRGPGYVIYGSNTLLGVIHLTSDKNLNQLYYDVGRFDKSNMSFSTFYIKNDLHMRFTLDDGAEEFHKTTQTDTLLNKYEMNFDTKRKDQNLQLSAFLKKWSFHFTNDSFKRNIDKNSMKKFIAEDDVKTRQTSSAIIFNSGAHENNRIHFQLSFLESTYKQTYSNYIDIKPYTMFGPAFEGFTINSSSLHATFEYLWLSNKFGSTHTGVDILKQDIKKAFSFSNTIITAPKDVGTIEFVDIYETSFPSEKRRNSNIASIYYQNQINISEHLEFTNGLRIESSDIYGINHVLRAGLVYSKEQNVFKLLYGEGIMQPYLENSKPTITTSPALFFDPTKSESIELIYWLKRNNFWQVMTLYYINNFTTYYETQVRNGNDFQVNSSSRKVSGYEWECHWDFPRGGYLAIDHSANQYISPDDYPRDEPLSSSPKKYSIRGRTRGRVMWCHFNWIVAGPLSSLNSEKRVKFLNLGIGILPVRSLELKGEILNLFDSQPWPELTNVTLTPQIGRSYLVSLTWKTSNPAK